MLSDRCACGCGVKLLPVGTLCVWMSGTPCVVVEDWYQKPRKNPPPQSCWTVAVRVLGPYPHLGGVQRRALRVIANPNTPILR